jgi:DNA-binding transcriptional LysR family regulator
LQDIEGALTPDTFDPAAAEGGFTIAAETYGTIVVLPQLVEIRKEAPRIEITVCSGSADEILAGIDRGSFDLAIGSFRHLPDRFMTCHLLSDEHVCVMRSGHPEAQVALSLEKYLAADHLLLSTREVTAGSRTARTSATTAYGPPRGKNAIILQCTQQEAAMRPSHNARVICVSTSGGSAHSEESETPMSRTPFCIGN